MGGRGGTLSGRISKNCVRQNLPTNVQGPVLPEVCGKGRDPGATCIAHRAGRMRLPTWG